MSRQVAIPLILTVSSSIAGCGGIPNLPSMPTLPSVPIPTVAEVTEKQPEVSLDCVREGDGFLSFSYEEGHLEALTLKQTDEEITLSKGVTIIQKVPLGRYNTTVIGHQKIPTDLQTNLVCDGETKAYVFRLNVPSSAGGSTGVTTRNLEHPYGRLVVGSALEDFNVKLTKIDAPYMIFEDTACDADERCPPTDNQTFVGATMIRLPEGEYFVKPSSGNGQATYIEASSYTAIEVTIDGIEITSQEIVLPSAAQQAADSITNTATIMEQLLKR